MESFFDTFAEDSVALECDEAERFVFALLFVDRSDDFFDFTVPREVGFHSFVGSIWSDSTDKHLSVSPLGFFGVDHFAVKFVGALGYDSIAGGVV